VARSTKQWYVSPSIAVCCSVLQCVAVCCSGSQPYAMVYIPWYTHVGSQHDGMPRSNASHRAAMPRSTMQCLVLCNAFAFCNGITLCNGIAPCNTIWHGTLQCDGIADRCNGIVRYTTMQWHTAVYIYFYTYTYIQTNIIHVCMNR